MTNENDTRLDNVDYTEDENYGYEQDIDEDSEVFEENDSDEYEIDEDNYDYETPVKKSGSKVPLVILLILIVILALIGIFLLVKLLSGINLKDESSPNKSVSVNRMLDIKQQQEEIMNSFFEDNSEDSQEDMLKVSFNDSKDGNADTKNITKKNNESGDNFLENSVKEADNQLLGNTGMLTEFGEKQADNSKNLSDDIETTDEYKQNENNSIMVAWNKTAVRNPFKPPVIQKTADDNYEKFGDVQFEIIEPPKQILPDATLTKLLQTQISGILYDEDSPSAIVNLAGNDQFVKIGDEIAGYKIKNITKTKVEISYKNNTYVASVGELFVPGSLEMQPVVVNLNNKFAGRYKEENLEE